MKHRRGVLAVVAVLATIRPAFAEERAIPPADGADGFTLDQAIAIARSSHPLLRAARSSVRVAEGNAVTAGHWANPLVDASYFQALRNSSYDPLGTPAIGLTQFLELAGAPTARRRSAESEVRATRADREGVARDLAWSVREAFIRLTAAYARRRIRAEARADLERAASIVRARVGSGMAPRYDASRVQLALDQAGADLGSADGDVARARGELDVAVGPQAGELRGEPRLALLDVPALPPLATSVDAARVARPEVVAARHRADSAQTDIDVARRTVFPGIGVRLGVGFGQSAGQLDVGAGVVVPLPLVERGQGAVRAAEARAEGSRLVAEALGTAAAQRVAATHVEAGRRREALARFRAATETSPDGMRAEAEAGYREAKLSVLELVDAYTSVLDARLRLVQLAEDAQLARLALDRGSAEAPPP